MPDYIQMKIKSEQERADLIRIDAARRDHPEWSRMINDQLSATMTATLRDWPYSYLPRSSILNWIDSLK